MLRLSPLRLSTARTGAAGLRRRAASCAAVSRGGAPEPSAAGAPVAAPALPAGRLAAERRRGAPCGGAAAAAAAAVRRRRGAAAGCWTGGCCAGGGASRLLRLRRCGCAAAARAAAACSRRGSARPVRPCAPAPSSAADARAARSRALGQFRRHRRQLVRPHRAVLARGLALGRLDVDDKAVVLAEGAHIDLRAEIEAHEHRIVVGFAVDRFDHRRQRRLGVRQVEAQHRIEGQRELVPGIVRRDADQLRQIEHVARERRLGDRPHPDRRHLVAAAPARAAGARAARPRGRGGPAPR